jgi:hypothetical protein
MSISECLKVYGGIQQRLTSRGFKTKLQTLDNDASSALKSLFTENEHVPPYCQRCNAAERVIQNFNEHFVSGLASVDPVFRLHLWYIILPQAEMNLNLLRKSRQHPQLSAASHYHGMEDYHKIYFAPP